MATTKITSNVLAPSAAQTNINNDGSFTLSVPTQINNTLSLSGNLTVDTNTFFVDSVNNRVGVGTTAPAAPLHINTSQDGVAVRIGQDGTVGRLEFGNINVALSRGSNRLALQGYDGFTFGTFSGEKMRVTSEGFLGIGTATPSAKLDVRSTETGVSYFNSSAASTRLLIDNAANTGFGLQIAGATKFSNAVYQSGTGNFDFTIYNDQLSQPSLFVDGSTNNVGIGTTTPTEKLTVAGNISVTGNISATGNLTVDTNTLFVDSVNNRVGIGTTTPDNPLTVQFNSSDPALPGIKLLNSNGSGKAVFTAINNAGVDMSVGVFGNSVGAGLANTASIASSTGVVIMSNGGVGSGGTDPISFRTGGYSVGAERMRIDSSGNVGIGTTTATEKLTVAGNISVTGNISTTGHFSAATKSFKIPHQSKGGHLQYGVVESDCHSVLVRGKISSDTITLPEHWSWLVDADSVTVQLTPVGCYQQLYIVSSDNQTVKVGGVTGEYCYVVYGTRKDVAPLEVEIE